MAKRSEGDSCCLTLPLRLEKWQEDRLAKRLEIARQIYNSFVAAKLKDLQKLERTPEYREVQALIRKMGQENRQNEKTYKEARKKRDLLLKTAGFTEFGFKKLADKKEDRPFGIGPHYKQNGFNKSVGSAVAAHDLAARAWQAFEKKIYHGKRVHFKRRGELNSVKGYSVAGNGGVEIRFRGTYIQWKDLHLPLKLDPDNPYETEMLKKRVKYVRILRRPGKNRDRWYAQLTLEGKPVVKRAADTGEPLHSVGHGTVGIDIGPRTIAYAAQDDVGLRELADRVQNIEHEKRLLQRKMDRSRRATNPGNYNPDGTIRRGVRLTRYRSRRYIVLQKKLAALQHRQAVIRKEQHTALANYLISLGDRFYVEDMDWPGLAHRAKKTEKSEKTGRFKRKKRFGKSIGNKAPATLILILTQKCKSLGLPGVVKVDTHDLKASQYNHLTDSYEKKELSERWNNMPDGRRIQRDMYSAFLLQHAIEKPQSTSKQKAGLYEYDKAQLQADYEGFVQLHDQEIDRLAHLPKTIASMGIMRTVS